MKRFEPNKTITELGIDTTRKFVVADSGYPFKEGEILTLVLDDNSRWPMFTNGEISDCFPLCRLAYAEEEFTRGERVLVRDYDGDNWEECIYLTTIEGSFLPFKTVSRCHEEEFENGEEFYVGGWGQIKKLETEETITIGEHTYNKKEFEEATKNLKTK